MLTLLIAVAMCYAFARVCLPLQEKRSGLTVLNDPLLPLLPRRDMSWITSKIMLAVPTISMFEILIFSEFYHIELYWMKFGIISWIKAFMLYLTPLETPDGYIMLTDSMCSHFQGHSETFGRDLFFSSHTSIMILCFLHATSLHMRILYTVSAVCVAILLMVNRVHYSIDIVVAPFVTYCVHVAVESFFNASYSHVESSSQW